MKTITIQKESWIDRIPRRKRGEMVKAIYSLATEFGWDIRMAGQHYGQG